MTNYIDISKELQEQREQYEKYREATARILKVAPDSDLKVAMEEYLVKINGAIASIDVALKMIPRGGGR
jgi:hypothetical protein